MDRRAPQPASRAIRQPNAASLLPIAILIGLGAASVLLTSCGGFAGAFHGFYTVSGTVTGLTGAGMALQDNGGDTLPLGAGANTFTFSTKILSGNGYHVTVSSQPTGPLQTCVVANGSGTVSGNVINVEVTCTTKTFTISGSLTNLTGSGLVLVDNGTDGLPVSADATTFTFDAAVPSGGSYSVAVFSQPNSPNQQCSVTNGSGPVVNANITSVVVTCVTSLYTISGTVFNLAGTGLVLQNDGTDNLAATNGSFTFTVALPSGSPYNVTVLAEPTDPAQTCGVLNGAGIVTGDVTNVVVQCGLGDWTWMGGSDTVNQRGVYGQRGTPNPNNVPGARNAAASWTDAQGNFWLFGGFGYDSTGGNPAPMNDLWEYSNGEWTWVSGSDTSEQAGNYGNLGMASPTNVPGARNFAYGWADSSGNFWLFGGVGADSAGIDGGFLNDLWEFSGGEWTWMGGSKLANERGSYGMEGQPGTGNVPGGRAQFKAWVDPSGSLWVFGGTAIDENGAIGEMNDLWRYSGGAWTWMSGSGTMGATGVYGTPKIPAPGNVPGARSDAVGWADASGNLWLFGGSTTGDTNDLWKYGGGEWAWMGGSDVPGAPGNYGTEGVPAASNVPGARVLPSAWKDSAGNFWLFGGAGGLGGQNDLWEYDPATGDWTWMSGSTLANQSSVYGMLGVPAPGNIPSARYTMPQWIDSNGNLWLMGGFVWPQEADGNDLWRYTGTAAANPAGSLTWNLVGVRFGNGDTASGSFAYNAATNTVSNINIVSTSATFTQLAPTFPVRPNEFAFIPNVTLTTGNSTPALVFFPSPGLTNSGGTVSLCCTNGFSAEGAICDAACDGVTTGSQLDAGDLVASDPEEEAMAAKKSKAGR